MPGERIIITHPRAILDPGFRAAHALAGAPTLFAATVDDRGSFRLIALGDPGDRVLAEAALDLPRLLAPTAVPAAEHQGGSAQTAIERSRPFHLRLPHPCRREHCWDLGATGVVCALPDGRCTWWDTKQQGPRELTAVLPEGRPLLIDEDDQGFRIVLSGRPANRLTLCLVTRDGTLRTVVLGEQLAVRAVFSRSGDLVAVFEDRIMVYRGNGDLAAELDVDHRIWLWLRDRFFFQHGQVVSLAWDGQHLTWHKFPEAVPLVRQRLMVFDRDGMGWDGRSVVD